MCACNAAGNGYDDVPSAAGSDTQIQYNNGGVLGGAAGATYNDTSGLVTLQHQTDTDSAGQLDIRGPDRATPANNDDLYLSATQEVDDGFEEIGRLEFSVTDVTTATEDSRLTFEFRTDGSTIPQANPDWLMTGAVFQAGEGTAAQLNNTTPSATAPSLLPNAGDPDTGVGHTDNLVSIIAGGVSIGAFDANTGVSGQLRLPQDNSPAAPTLAFGDGDSGAFQPADNQVGLVADGEEFARITDPGDVVSGEVLRLAGPNRATPADNDEAYISFFNEESGGGSEEFSRVSFAATDVTATEEDAAIIFEVDV
ncbi:MAG: hypothetical protein ACYSW0_22735, partial [Planctomycetota bacterium]